MGVLDRYKIDDLDVMRIGHQRVGDVARCEQPASLGADPTGGDPGQRRRGRGLSAGDVRRSFSHHEASRPDEGVHRDLVAQDTGGQIGDRPARPRGPGGD
jgi:hypothetical protein